MIIESFLVKAHCGNPPVKEWTEVTKPFLQRMSAIESGMIPQEIEVAALIREGQTSQQIADRLRLSVTTIHFHRRNLRKKLNIKNTGTNLRTFLASLA